MSAAGPLPAEELRIVSNRLAALRDRLGPMAHGGCHLLSCDVVALMEELADLSGLAKRLENEISARRWNEKARADRDALDTATVLAQVQQNNSNLVLLPVVPRPFNDGGGA
ncbi:MAG: hypothetical protein NXH91_11965 [Phyllobacteriaceae bacterium]|nr:hypothetical protein [Phyllobacteriaceae bacterium]